MAEFEHDRNEELRTSPPPQRRRGGGKFSAAFEIGPTPATRRMSGKAPAGAVTETMFSGVARSHVVRDSAMVALCVAIVLGFLTQISRTTRELRGSKSVQPATPTPAICRCE
jgi:hypothetical protein